MSTASEGWASSLVEAYVSNKDDASYSHAISELLGNPTTCETLQDAVVARVVNQVDKDKETCSKLLSLLTRAPLHPEALSWVIKAIGMHVFDDLLAETVVTVLPVTVLVTANQRKHSLLLGTKENLPEQTSTRTNTDHVAFTKSHSRWKPEKLGQLRSVCVAAFRSNSKHFTVLLEAFQNCQEEFWGEVDTLDALKTCCDTSPSPKTQEAVLPYLFRLVESDTDDVCSDAALLVAILMKESEQALNFCIGQIVMRGSTSKLLHLVASMPRLHEDLVPLRLVITVLCVNFGFTMQADLLLRAIAFAPSPPQATLWPNVLPLEFVLETIPKVMTRDAETSSGVMQLLLTMFPQLAEQAMKLLFELYNMSSRDTGIRHSVLTALRHCAPNVPYQAFLSCLGQLGRSSDSMSFDTFCHDELARILCSTKEFVLQKEVLLEEACDLSTPNPWTICVLLSAGAIHSSHYNTLMEILGMHILQDRLYVYKASLEALARMAALLEREACVRLLDKVLLPVLLARGWADKKTLQGISGGSSVSFLLARMAKTRGHNELWRAVVATDVAIRGVESQLLKATFEASGKLKNTLRPLEQTLLGILCSEAFKQIGPNSVFSGLFRRLFVVEQSNREVPAICESPTICTIVSEDVLLSIMQEERGRSCLERTPREAPDLASSCFVSLVAALRDPASGLSVRLDRERRLAAFYGILLEQIIVGPAPWTRCACTLCSQACFLEQRLLWHIYHALDPAEADLAMAKSAQRTKENISVATSFGWAAARAKLSLKHDQVAAILSSVSLLCHLADTMAELLMVAKVFRVSIARYDVGVQIDVDPQTCMDLVDLNLSFQGYMSATKTLLVPLFQQVLEGEDQAFYRAACLSCLSAALSGAKPCTARQDFLKMIATCLLAKFDGVAELADFGILCELATLSACCWFLYCASYSCDDQDWVAAGAHLTEAFEATASLTAAQWAQVRTDRLAHFLGQCGSAITAFHLTTMPPRGAPPELCTAAASLTTAVARH